MDFVKTCNTNDAAEFAVGAIAYSFERFRQEVYKADRETGIVCLCPWVVLTDEGRKLQYRGCDRLRDKFSSRSAVFPTFLEAPSAEFLWMFQFAAVPVPKTGPRNRPNN